MRCRAGSVASLAYLPSGGRFSFPTHHYSLVFLLKQGDHLSCCSLSTAGGCDSFLKQPASKTLINKLHGLQAWLLLVPKLVPGEGGTGDNGVRV